jgi:integrase
MTLSKRSNGLYYVWYIDRDGKRKKISTGTKLKQEATRFLVDFAHKQKAQEAQPAPLTLSQFTQEFLAHSACVHAPKTSQVYATALQEFRLIVGDLLLSEVTPRTIEEFIRAKHRSVTDATVRTYFTHLSAAFETGRQWHHIATNPFKEAKKPGVAEAVPVFLTEEEFNRLLANVVDGQLRDVFIAAALTGLRLGELLALQWSDIDFSGKTILIQSKAFFKTKSRRIRRIAITDQLSDVLLQRREGSQSSYVFQKEERRLRGEWVSKSFKAAVRKAGLDERLHFHSMRHAYASWLVQKGASLYEVQKLLGHSSIAVTQIYAHLAPSELHDTVNRIRIDLHQGVP